MTQWFVKATIEEDVCLATRYGSASEFASEQYIPGSALWGALAHHSGVSPGIAPDGEDFRVVFHSGEIRFLNLYPCVGVNGRSLPVPRSARERKDAPGFDRTATLFGVAGPHDEQLFLQAEGVYDWLVRGVPGDADEWQRADGFYGQPYAQGAPGQPRPRGTVVPAMVLNGHVDRSTPAGTARDGRLFVRHDLVRGGEFVGAIVATTEPSRVALERVLARTPDFGRRVRLGRQPGHATVLLTQGAPLPWADLPQEFGDGALITVTLLSNAIVVDEWLRPRTDLPASHVAGALGLDAECVRPERHFSSTTVLHGWNGAYNRPRELEVAIAMGSAFLYGIQWPETLSREERVARLARLQLAGIGLRRSEGFGEVRVNDPFHRVHAPGGVQ